MLKLNVGSGANYMPGWVNVDGCDLFKRDKSIILPDEKLENMFGKDSVDEIYMSDVMEHFFRWDGIEVLKDFFAVMKPGGLVTIVTPDLMRLITTSTLTLQRKTELIRGAQGQPGPQEREHVMKAWKAYPKFFSHPYTWTEGELRGVMVSLGFIAKITNWRCDWYMAVSAIKPLKEVSVV